MKRELQLAIVDLEGGGVEWMRCELPDNAAAVLSAQEFVDRYAIPACMAIWQRIVEHAQAVAEGDQA